jgi:hypothetical protein
MKYGRSGVVHSRCSLPLAVDLLIMLINPNETELCEVVFRITEPAIHHVH